MIPKTIHYCWFGNNPKPRLAKKCIRSWKRFCPDYEIIEWNESNYDLSSAPLFVRQAYKMGKWAFVTDYVRLWTVYNFGGLYFDTDIRLIRSPDELLKNKTFFAFEQGGRIATGLGFGAEKGTGILRELMSTYEDIPFVLNDGTCDLTVCGARDTEVFRKYGFENKDEFQNIAGAVIYPSEYFCASIWNPKTENTYTVNYYSGSWRDKEDRNEYLKKFKEARKKHYLSIVVHLPNALVRMIIGKNKYDNLKVFLKNKK